MAHGYLREGYGMWGDFDPDREGRERDRDWRDRDRDRFMFRDRDRERSDAGEWFGGRGDREPERRRFSSNRDDHYRSWRDRQMEALDRDYADYCREREQQFHQEFDAWRNQRRGSPQPLQTGMTQTGMSHDPTGMRQAETPSSPAESEGDPMDSATLGTSSGRRGRG